MGMFGFFYSLIIGGTYVGNEVYSVIKDKKLRETKGNKEFNYYVDSKGKTRSLTTNRIITMDIDPYTKDVVNYDCRTGDIDYNISAAEREIAKSKAIKNNKSVYMYNKDNHYQDRIRGVRYVDIKTGRLVVVRVKFPYTFYMDAETGKLIRRADIDFENEKFVSNNNKDFFSINNPYDIILKFNNELNNETAEYMKKFLCNHNSMWWEYPIQSEEKLKDRDLCFFKNKKV